METYKSYKHLVFIALLAFAAGFWQCAEPAKVSSINFSYLYDFQKKAFNPNYKVFHNSDTTSFVYFSIPTNELLYAKKPNDSAFVAKVKLNYKLYESFDSPLVLDSGTLDLSDTVYSFSQTQSLIGSFQIVTEPKEDYVLTINATDAIRSTSLLKYIEVDKTKNFNRQYFLMHSTSVTGALKYSELVKPNELCRIETNKAVKKITWKYYPHEFPMALPPFSDQVTPRFDYKNSKQGEIQVQNGFFDFTPTEEGIYFFQVEPNSSEGFTLVCLRNNFPEFLSVQELIQPVRYISSKREFSGLENAEQLKIALDEYWLSKGETTEKTKEVIKGYYSRAAEANKLFTSYKEGWKTDRGMVYIIFGPPQIVYKSNYSESWVYGTAKSSVSLTFNFSRVSNPFTNNDFTLQRSIAFKTYWYRAVEAWRSGRVPNF